VTGGNRGVGFHTAKILLNRGYHVIILSRSASRGEAASNKLKQLTGNSNCSAHQLDLNDMGSIYKFVESMESRKVVIHSLVNNAGAISMESMHSNHFGHFALTLGLLPGLRRGLKTGHRVTVVNVSSVAHMDGSLLIDSTLTQFVEYLRANENNNIDVTEYLSSLYKHNSWLPYAQSKSANVIFSFSLSKILEVEGLAVSSVHPGVMMTDLWRGSGETGAQATENNPVVSSEGRSSAGNRVGSGDTFDHSNSRNQSTVSNAGSAESGREFFRYMTCCCVKHPVVSAVAISALAAPRFTFNRCCFIQSSSNRQLSSESTKALYGCSKSLQSYCFTGTDGGYYQQCMCCCVVPLRASPPLYNPRIQTLLWESSFQFVKHEHAQLYEFVVTHLNDSGGADTPTDKISMTELPHRKLISTALPCTELCALAPYNICWACLC
jgi:NAD(P)-dependent dehydrogenase (short-subunit alcohol dehydrogenase family)